MLFDSSENYSFLSQTFVQTLHVRSKRLDCGFDVKVEDNSRVVVGEMYTGCSIYVDGYSFSLFLYSMGIYEGF